jgi:hypothetical protein
MSAADKGGVGCVRALKFACAAIDRCGCVELQASKLGLPLVPLFGGRTPNFRIAGDTARTVLEAILSAIV